MIQSADEPDAASASASSGGGLLLALAAFLLLLFVLSDALLTSSTGFWKFCRRGGLTGPNAALVFESMLRRAEPGHHDLVVVGSSVVARDIDRGSLGEALGMPEERILVAPLLGASSLELAMLAPLVVERRPLAVVQLVTPWTLRKEVQWDRLRFYDPRVAHDLFSWRELLDERSTHAAGALAASHVVIRHRASLRDLLLDPLLDATGGDDVRSPDADDSRLRARKERFRATLDDFACEGPHLRAIEETARRLQQAGIGYAVVSTPVSGRWGRDPALTRMIDDCLGAQARETGHTYLPRRTWNDVPPGLFSDPLHMKPAARDSFSAEVGRVLRGLFPELHTVR